MRHQIQKVAPTSMLLLVSEPAAKRGTLSVCIGYHDIHVAGRAAIEHRAIGFLELDAAERFAAPARVEQQRAVAAQNRSRGYGGGCRTPARRRAGAASRPASARPR